MVSTSPPPPRLQDIERQTIIARLRAFQGDKPATAKSLGLSLRSLYHKLARYVMQGHLSAEECDGWKTREQRHRHQGDTDVSDPQPAAPAGTDQRPEQ